MKSVVAALVILAGLVASSGMEEIYTTVEMETLE
jgi:hypothetical protein